MNWGQRFWCGRTYDLSDRGGWHRKNVGHVTTLRTATVWPLQPRPFDFVRDEGKDSCRIRVMTPRVYGHVLGIQFGFGRRVKSGLMGLVTIAAAIQVQVHLGTGVGFVWGGGCDCSAPCRTAVS